MGLTRLEELNLAIDSCKEMILSSEEHSERRRKLVAKLVQLRLQIQEIKEGKEVVSEQVKMVCGHQFELQERSGRNPYCEQCRGIVWRFVQNWYRCKVCGYRSHEKCLDFIRRICAGVQARNSPHYILKICPEKGLAAQKYRCTECKARLAFSQSKELEPRLCDYTGLFFCCGCHWNDLVVIPARVVHNWDFQPRPVSRSSKQLLEILHRKPLLNVEKLNPALFSYIEELRLIRKLRSDILLMKCYFVCCKAAREEKILWHLKRHQHFVEGAILNSLMDLEEIQDGRLEGEMRAIISIFLQHIKVDCESCRGNGFICELCPDKEIIFPFDDYVSICRVCCAVFHRRCFEKKSKECPRCDRRETRRISLRAELTPDSSPERTAQKPTVVLLPTSPPCATSTPENLGRREGLNPFEGDEDNTKSSSYDDHLNPFA